MYAFTKKDNLHIISMLNLKLCIKPLSFMSFKWIKPPQSYCKLNVDGFSKGNPGSSGCGGIITDQYGGFMADFAHFLGFQTTLYDKVEALKYGFA